MDRKKQASEVVQRDSRVSWMIDFDGANELQFARMDDLVHSMKKQRLVMDVKDICLLVHLDARVIFLRMGTVLNGSFFWKYFAQESLPNGLRVSQNAA
jgi:hypothetical protein